MLVSARAFLVALLLCSGAPLAARQDAAPWLDDLDSARDEARKSGKPLMVVFR